MCVASEKENLKIKKNCGNCVATGCFYIQISFFWNIRVYAELKISQFHNRNNASPKMHYVVVFFVNFTNENERFHFSPFPLRAILLYPRGRGTHLKIFQKYPRECKYNWQHIKLQNALLSSQIAQRIIFSVSLVCGDIHDLRSLSRQKAHEPVERRSKEDLFGIREKCKKKKLVTRY